MLFYNRIGRKSIRRIDFTAHTVLIINIITRYSLPEDVQVEIVNGKCIVEAKAPCGLRIAYDTDVFFIYFSIPVEICIFGISRLSTIQGCRSRFILFPHSGKGVAQECTHRLSYHLHVRAYQSGKVGIAGVNHHIGKAIQFQNFVLIIVHRIVYIPFEVFCRYGNTTECQVKTPIGYRAYICQDRFYSQCRGHLLPHQQIGCLLLVILGRKTQPAAPPTAVDTYIQLIRTFPLQVFITQLGNGKGRIVVGIQAGSKLQLGGKRRNSRIAHRSVAGP